jgi:tagatose-1,6-bisphosphate aldolase
MTVNAIRDQQGFFSILELDRTPNLAELLSLDLSLPANLEFLEEINKLILDLSKEATALLFDPVYSLSLIANKSKKSGSLIRLEQNKEFLPNNLPELFPDFSLEEVKNNYSLVKLELFYHPREARAIEKKQLLAEIKNYCQSLGINFLLKLKIYDYAAFLEEAERVQLPDFSYTESQLAAIQELRGLADILVLEAPEDPLMLATISTELDIPWLAFSQQETTYEQFKDRFRMAMENGASGFMLGELLWQEIANFKLEDQSYDFAAIKKYFKTTVRDRIIELNRIAAESISTEND